VLLSTLLLARLLIEEIIRDLFQFTLRCIEPTQDVEVARGHVER
jgi:hypothetical protein